MMKKKNSSKNGKASGSETLAQRLCFIGSK